MTDVQEDKKHEIMKIDVREVLRSKNPSLERLIPGFMINYLRRIVHQDELNDFLEKHGHLKDAGFIQAGLDYFGITYSVTGRENIPSAGRYIFVSNHPLGGLDGLVFIHELSKHLSGLKFPVNDILMNITNLSGIFLPVNKHGAQDRTSARLLEDAYASDNQILYFPAGLCSRKKKGVIRDLKWHKSFIVKSVQYQRDVVPCFFSGRNSEFFYKLSNIRKFLGIKANIEMLYLVDELFRQQGKTISLTFGTPISWKTFDTTKKAVEWADWVKMVSYSLVPKTIA
ncbi:MAG: 1-acyl-sn-glycerol-3-phosphate acyltransferase [Bacteroidales bacterium]|jgi:putative hemolysin|nr:1-acyl-sn-glycerol-3-phosphate acyltransferase [Bacteroidales bacterium]